MQIREKRLSMGWDECGWNTGCNTYMKEYKLYNKLLDKISPKIELSVFDPFRKDRPISVSILQILIPFIQNNSSTYLL